MIRRLISNDIEQLNKIEHIIFENNAYSKNVLVSELSLKNRIYLGYFKDDVLIGYLGVMISDCAEIIKIGVVPKYHRQGIATSLLNEMIKILKIIEAETIILEVNENNINAIKFYETIGFKKIAVRKNYYGKDSAKIYKLEI